MYESLQHYLKRTALLPAGECVVVGVSGGADSLALAHLLWRLKGVLGFTLHMATFDHGLRGEESAADAAFVGQMAARWGVAVTVGKGNVTNHNAGKSVGIEQAARLARYAFLAEVARKVGAKRVAVGHHLDDQAETVLLHLLRGAGGKGLTGMRACAPLPNQADLWLVRPLLGFSRAQIEAYCTENGLVPRHDSSNADTTLLRNRLRLEVLPQLETINPQIRTALARMAESVALDQDYLDEQCAAFSASCEIHEKSVNIPKRAFRGLHPALARRALLWATGQLQSADALPDYAHVLHGLEIATRGNARAVALLGHGLRLRVERERLVVEYNILS